MAIGEKMDGMELRVHFNNAVLHSSKWMSGDFFASSIRGLKQGIPYHYFPFSFLVMEGPSMLLQAVGFQQGFQVCSLALSVAYLYFANSTIIF